MSELKGTTVIVPEQDDGDRYRPTASTVKLYERIEQALREVVSEAIHQAGGFAHLSWVDREEGVPVRYGHLVDANECLDIAMVYVEMLKQVVSHRVRVETERDTGDSLPF